MRRDCEKGFDKGLRRKGLTEGIEKLGLRRWD
jgi:hypothetical protein